MYFVYVELNVEQGMSINDWRSVFRLMVFRIHVLNIEQGMSIND